MARMTTKLMLATALIALSACATKKQPLPPPPSPQPTPTYTPQGDGIVPGSRADFQRSVTSDTIHFAFDRYDVDAPNQAILDSQIAWLAKWPNVPVSIEGHCDERGTREYNFALGARRAESIKDYLISRGVSPARITTISYGKEKPIDAGTGEEAWAHNRNGHTGLTGGVK